MHVANEMCGGVQEGAGTRVGSHAVLYKRGAASDTFTLVLQGRLLVWAGAEEFASEVGPWQSVGHKALQAERYYPDFTACTTGPCRLIQIDRAAFQQVRAFQPPSSRLPAGTRLPRATLCHVAAGSRCGRCRWVGYDEIRPRA